nr:PCYCGC motif-containing (lipo)protein [Paenibacillus sp. PL91]MBC9199068.1 hypothetical protein [Paenibacillus sp. PL91]
MYSVVLSSLLLSACGSAANSNKQTNEAGEVHNADHGHHQTASGDLQEKTASLSVLPTFLEGATPTVQTAYKTAATVTDILPYIPCYCGCGESAGHMSNLNCFIAKQNDDGSVIWDDHGTRCGVCIEIAVTAAAMKASGIEAERIRQIIDETYKEGYAKATQTELPPAS